MTLSMKERRKEAGSWGLVRVQFPSDGSGLQQITSDVQFQSSHITQVIVLGTGARISYL